MCSLLKNGYAEKVEHDSQLHMLAKHMVLIRIHDDGSILSFFPNCEILLRLETN